MGIKFLAPPKHAQSTAKEDKPIQAIIVNNEQVEKFNKNKSKNSTCQPYH